MDTFILKLKHWQIVVTIWIVPLVFLFIELLETSYHLLGFKISIAIFGLLTYLYYAVLSNSLYKLYPNKTYTRHYFYISLHIINIAFCVFTAFSIGDQGVSGRFELFLFPAYMISAILCISYAANNYRIVEYMETGKNENDFIMDLFLFFMMPYFIWFTQPKLNKLIEKYERDHSSP